MPAAILTVTYADGQTISQQAGNLPDARRALLKLVNRNGWHINGNGSVGTLHTRVGTDMIAAYIIRTPATGQAQNNG